MLHRRIVFVSEDASRLTASFATVTSAIGSRSAFRMHGAFVEKSLHHIRHQRLDLGKPLESLIRHHDHFSALPPTRQLAWRPGRQPGPVSSLASFLTEARGFVSVSLCLESVWAVTMLTAKIAQKMAQFMKLSRHPYGSGHGTFPSRGARKCSRVLDRQGTSLS